MKNLVGINSLEIGEIRSGTDEYYRFKQDYFLRQLTEAQSHPLSDSASCRHRQRYNCVDEVKEENCIMERDKKTLAL